MDATASREVLAMLANESEAPLRDTRRRPQRRRVVFGSAMVGAGCVAVLLAWAVGAFTQPPQALVSWGGSGSGGQQYARGTLFRLAVPVQNVAHNSITLLAASPVSSGCPQRLRDLQATKDIQSNMTPTYAAPNVRGRPIRGLEIQGRESQPAWYVIVDFQVPDFCFSTFGGLNVTYDDAGTSVTQFVDDQLQLIPDYTEPSVKSGTAPPI